MGTRLKRRRKTRREKIAESKIEKIVKMPKSLIKELNRIRVDGEEMDSEKS